MAIYVAPQEIGTYKGCVMFRQFVKKFIVDIKQESVQVLYNQWLVTPTQEIVDSIYDLQYMVKDIVAVEAVEQIMDEDGVTVLIPAVEAVAEFNGFTNWRLYNAGATADGTTMEAIFFGAINAQLRDIPMDATNPHLITD